MLIVLPSEYLTRAFNITESDTLCELTVDSNVDNGWVYLDVALVDDQERALLDFSSEASYYHGVEGGESWSEGSRRDSTVFKVKDPGQYRLLVLGQKGDSGPHGVKLTVAEGVSIGRYNAILAVLCLIGPIGFFVRRAMIEQARWGGDDD